MCDSSTKGLAAQGYANNLMGISSDHYADKGYNAFDPDGIGDGKPLTVANVALLTRDDVPNGITTTRTLKVDGTVVVSTIDTLGDKDFFKVELVEGRIYDISQFLTVFGPNKVPLSDSYLELYDATGKLIVSADGGGPNTPASLDALLTFTAKASGTYYINAQAYGDSAVGDYEISVKDVTDRPTYKPYYDLDSPLHSLDWGSQVDRTSRNPDGQEGPRPTGNPFTGVASNTFGIEGKNVITVYFAKAGDIFISQNPTDPGVTENMVAKGLQSWEKEAFLKAFQLYEQVADLVFVEVSNRAEADFKIMTYNGTPGPGASVLGRMNPPNEGNEGQAEFNSGDTRWTEDGLQQGGFYFTTLIHEFGHGLGMSHPHDTGGRSSVMRGAGGGTGGIGGAHGEFGLSQQVFTVLSYNKGWALSPYGTPKSGFNNAEHFGWAGTLGALDIAVIQDKYGVNEEWATGNNVYEIQDFNGKGNFYQTIWDAGGIDEIRYGGARDSVIDLRAATLKYEEGGGGRVSYAFGIHGGFTIANGAVIENASSGAGNDKLFGNDANNVLIAGAGNDAVSAGAGNDTLDGGSGNDTLSGGSGNDTFLFTNIGDTSGGAERDVITDFARGEDKIDLKALGAKGFIGDAAFSGRAGEVRFTSAEGATVVELDRDGDGRADLQIELSNVFGLSNGDFIDLPAGFEAKDGKMAFLSGRATNDLLTATTDPDGTNIQGAAGNDTLMGGQFDDMLTGGLGDDILTGRGGADQFRFFGTQIEGASDRDTITDLNFAEGDTIVLGSFGSGTFAKANGVNAHSNGTSATLDSWADIVAIDRASSLVSTSSTGTNGQDLLLSVIDSDGQVQNIVIMGGYAQYLSAAGGSGGSGGWMGGGGSEFAAF
jgi:Ca2+-binding RTX toxin-like protein